MAAHETHPAADATPVAHEAHHEHDYHEQLKLFGRTFPVPTYTGVFLILGVLTVIEVALFELPRGFFTAPIMIILSVIKAGLVVWFYMHLNKDSRIFLVALLVPTILVIVCTLFLLIVPPGGY
jgi:caa(3)-type oxidase subunit IV